MGRNGFLYMAGVGHGLFVAGDTGSAVQVIGLLIAAYCLGCVLLLDHLDRRFGRKMRELKADRRGDGDVS